MDSVPDYPENERLAIFVRTQTGDVAEHLEAVRRRFEDCNQESRITLQLDSDFEEGAVNLPTGKNDILTEEDVFDIFFLPLFAKILAPLHF